MKSEYGMTRRGFFKGMAMLGGAGLVSGKVMGGQSSGRQNGLPVVIASANGLRAVERAYLMIRDEKADVLDAVVSGVSINEDDPDDNSVGYGGLPNEEGVVELDASVMHGPTGRAGAVAALRDIKNPSKVARMVLKRTDHVLLVGEGALRFALAHGFKREELLTEKSRIAWLAWKERMSDRDAWGPGLATPESELKKDEEKRLQGMLMEAGHPELYAWVKGVLEQRPQGTINCLGVDVAGDISGVTTTSGLAWKLSGRVGDSPLIGCGVFVDNSVGAAGSTGRGEECIKINGAHTVVEMMRRGASPREAAMEAIKRIAANYRNDQARLGQFNIIFYALNKRGEHGAAALWSGSWRIDRFTPSQYAVADGSGYRLLKADYLFEKRAAS